MYSAVSGPQDCSTGLSSGTHNLYDSAKNLTRPTISKFTKWQLDYLTCSPQNKSQYFYIPETRVSLRGILQLSLEQCYFYIVAAVMATYSVYLGLSIIICEKFHEKFGHEKSITYIKIAFFPLDQEYTCFFYIGCPY